MGEADNALRDEIEKVRERARLQALAQGIGPDAATAQGNLAVEEFCARWGIRPEMVGPGVLGGRRAPAPAPTPVREDARKVDLGASPMRSSANPGQTQAIRIADLLKRAKESEAALAPPPLVLSPAAPSPASPTRVATNLSSLLQRMRTADPTQSLPASSPAPAPTPAPAYAGRTGTVAAPPPSPLPPARPGTAGDVFGGSGSGVPNAERRRQVLEEFDRTYAEVQTMLEQRIGVVDIALDDASKGLSGVVAKAQAGGLAAGEVEILSTDVDRLRRQLTVMMQLCDEFLQHMDRIQAARAAGK